MGTRGAFGVIINEKEKIGYNQFDSYPSGKGVENLEWLRTADFNKLEELAEACKLVDDDVKPTPDDVKKLKPYTDLQVSEQSTDDWYCLTRHTQGRIDKMLESGYIYDMHNFPLDSLFCEWGYMLDLDQYVFEVYEGYQQKPHSEGRFAGRAEKPADWEPRYNGDVFWYPIKLIARYSLDMLPGNEDFLALESREEALT
jgi:hypothetical protein